MRNLYSSFQRMGFRYFLVCFQIFFSASVVFAQHQPDGITPGILNIKVTEEIASQLEQSRVSRSADDVLLTGIQSIDAVHRRYQVRGMQRVFRPGGSFEAKHRKYGLHLWYQVNIDSTVSASAVVAAYKSLPGIIISEPVHEKTSNHFKERSLTDSLPTLEPGTLPRATKDPRFPLQWHFNNSGDYWRPPGIDIKLLYAWEFETGSSDVVVAVVDGGIDTSHPDLSANLWRNAKEIPSNKIDDDRNGYIDDVHGYNFAYDRGPVDASYHATHVAGTVAATSNNGIGVAGVAGGSGAGDGARLMSCAVFSNSGVSGSLAEAYVYSADNGAIISQNSWGYWEPGVFEQVVRDGIDYFIAEAGKNESGKQVGPMSGGIVIFAAGNFNSQEAWYPAFYDRTIAVAATSRSDEKASYSNYGEWIDIAAPGGDGEQDYYEEIWSTLPGNNYGTLRGTSMACPQVSGVAALIVSKFGGLGFTPEMLREKLLKGTESIDDKNPSFAGLLGSGRLNAYTALITNRGVPPDPILDLRAVNVNKDSVTLEWTTPGDADAETAYRYELRYAQERFTQQNFFNFGYIFNFPVSKIEGTQENYLISSLQPGTTYYFAIITYDFFGNVSRISNVVEQTTSPIAWLFLTKDHILSKMKTGQTRVYTFPIINQGGAPLNFKFIKQDAATFGVLSQTEGTVLPQDTLEIKVTLRSHNLVAGQYFQRYNIQSDAYYGSYPYFLQMIVTDIGTPVVSLAPKVIEFDNGYIGLPKEKTLIIHNDGTEPLVVTSVASEHPLFTTSFKGPLTIAPFEDAFVKVMFKATERRNYDKRLVVHSNDPTKPVAYVRMVANGVLPPDIEVSPTAVHVSLNTGQKISFPVSIKNTGLSDLEFSTEIINTNADTALVHRVLIITPDWNPIILTELFKGDDKIKADIFPRDSIHGIKLHHLVPYDVVFVSNGYTWASFGTGGSPTVIGDVLADYMDQGGKVILNMYTFFGPSRNEYPIGLKGRFIEEAYGPFLPSVEWGCSNCFLDTVLLPDHPLMKGITTLESQIGGMKLELAHGAIEIARWAGGDPLIAVKPGVVAVNTRIFENSPVLGDFPRLYQNAVKWLRSSFLSAGPARGIVAAGEEKTVNIDFDMTHMNVPGLHERILMIHHNVPGKKPLSIPITLNALGPVLAVSPDPVIAVLDSVQTGTRTIMLHNNSIATISFSVRVDSANYIQVLPASGTIAALDSIPLTLKFDARQVAFGEYINHLTFSVDGRDELVVPIILSVTDDPEIEVDPLELQATVGFREDTIRYFNIRNTGGSPLTFTIDVEGASTPSPDVRSGATLLQTGFEDAVFPPVAWEIVNNLEYGDSWDLTSGNYCGTGKAAIVYHENNDFGVDTELRSPEIFVQAYKQIVLEFAANHYGGQLYLDVLVDGKLPWKNILHWTPGHGWYGGLPGEFVSIPLDSILSEATYFQVRWRNYYLRDDYPSGYSQIDDVVIKADPVEWLAIQPAAGVIAAGDTAKIAAIFYAEDLEPQSYDANILVRSNAVHDPLVNIAASIQVLKPAILVLKPDSMYQTLRQGDSAMQVLTISNAGESPLRFTFDDVLVPTSATTARKERRVSSARSKSSRTTSGLNEAQAILRPASAQRVRSSPSSIKLYATGFEEFYPGELDLQEGWYADPGLWSIESNRPFGGTQHLRGVSDTYGFAAAFSPYIYWNLEEPWPATSSASMQINLDSALGGRWQVVPQSPQAGLVATRIDFTPEGTMRALVQDSIDYYSGYFVDIPVVLPKGYFELRIDVSGPEDNFKVYVNNKNVFTGNGFVSFIEEVAFLFSTDVPGLKMDVDNFRHYDGIPPLNWVKPEPVSGIVPGGESFPVNIHFNTSDLGTGTFYHNLTFVTNDPEQIKAALPVTLQVLGPGENSIPVIATVPDTSVVQTESLILTFTANDPDDSVVSVVIPDPPSFANKIDEGSGFVTYQFNPALTDQTGVYEMTVTATDADENSSSVLFRLTVLAYGIQNFSVVDMRTGSTLFHFDDSASLDVARQDFKHLTIRANTESETIRSVLFRIDGGKKNVENKAPYLLRSNFLRDLSPGPHLLEAEAYTQPSGRGIVQQYNEAVISIINSTAVSSFEVVNQYGERIQDLLDGDVLNAQDPQYKSMNIRALLTEDPLNGSVKFYLNEAPYRVENKPPYIMVSGNRKWWSDAGSYTVQATPFSKKNGNGVPGKSLAVTFSIADNRKGGGDIAARQQNDTEEESRELISAFPVPTDRFIHVSVYEDVPDLRVQVVIRNIHSQVLFNEIIVINAEPLTLDLEKIGLNDGVYYLQLRTPTMNKKHKIY